MGSQPNRPRLLNKLQSIQMIDLILSSSCVPHKRVCHCLTCIVCAYTITLSCDKLEGRSQSHIIMLSVVVADKHIISITADVCAATSTLLLMILLQDTRLTSNRHATQWPSLGIMSAAEHGMRQCHKQRHSNPTCGSLHTVWVVWAHQFTLP